MSAITNHSPFAVDVLSLVDASATELTVVVVSATFSVDADGEIGIAREQLPVWGSDQPWGDPETSSIRYEADIAFAKPMVDVVVNGAAVAPRGGRVRRVDVRVSIGSVRKHLVVSGDRQWRIGPLGRRPSRPRPFSRMPIVYERAYGGVAAGPLARLGRGAHFANPMGLGFRRAPGIRDDLATQVPNVEYAGHRIHWGRRRGRVAGMGFLGRHFSERLRYAGTYDEAWERDQAPLLPRDFDVRYFQAAPVDQRLPELKGGERIDILGMDATGRFRCCVPALDVPVHLRYPRRLVRAELRTDTLIVEPEERRLCLKARVSFPVDRREGPLKEVLVGHLANGLLRALRGGKDYRDPAEREGATRRPHYRV